MINRKIGEILDQLYKKRRLPDVIDFQAFKEQQRALFTALTQTAEDWLYLPDGTNGVRHHGPPTPLAAYCLPMKM